MMELFYILVTRLYVLKFIDLYTKSKKLILLYDNLKRAIKKINPCHVWAQYSTDLGAPVSRVQSPRGTEDIPLEKLATSPENYKRHCVDRLSDMFDLLLSILFPVRGYSHLVFSRLPGKPEREVVSSSVCFQLFKYP